MTRHSIQIVIIGSALALLASAANSGQDLVTAKDLDPFTHVVRIPADAEQSSFRFEQVKLVKISTKVGFAENAAYCEQLAFRDPGGSLYCPYAAFDGTTPAYEITYSYDGPAMASDQFGGKHFTFRAYFRPEDFSAATQKMVKIRDSVRETMSTELGSGRIPCATKASNIRRLPCPRNI